MLSSKTSKLDIHIFWSGPFSLEQIKEKNDKNHYGVYQVYGHHHLYGDNVLLYIGKAEKQTFGKRLSQEEWQFEYDPDNVSFYIGQLAIKDSITVKKWENLIGVSERLLIHAHNPAYNIAHTRYINEDEIKDIVIHNWNSFRNLFPSIAGSHYTSIFDDITEDNILPI